MNSVLRNVYCLVEGARPLVPHFSDAELSASDCDILLADRSICVDVYDGQTVPRVLTRHFNGVRHLFLHPDLTDAGRLFSILVSYAESGLTEASADEEACAAFAVWGIFHRAGCIAASPRWFDEVIDELAACPDLWGSVHLDQVLRTVNAAKSAAVGSIRPIASGRGPAAAMEMGRSSRQAGRFEEAEACFHDAIFLGEVQGQYEFAVDGRIGLGNVRRDTGDLRSARECYLDALRATREHELPHRMFAPLHELFALAVDTGDHAEADSFALAAFDAYAENPRLPLFATDVAWYWLMEGFYLRALPVLRLLTPYHVTAAERMILLGCLARATGATGDAKGFEAVFTEMTALALNLEASEGVALCYYDLACGASFAGQWGRADAAARCAISTAIERGEAGVRIKAELALRQIELRRPVPVSVRSSDPKCGEQMDKLAERMARALGELGGTSSEARAG